MGGTAKGRYAHPHTVPALGSVNSAVKGEKEKQQFSLLISLIILYYFLSRIYSRSNNEEPLTYSTYISLKHELVDKFYRKET